MSIFFPVTIQVSSGSFHLHHITHCHSFWIFQKSMWVWVSFMQSSLKRKKRVEQDWQSQDIVVASFAILLICILSFLNTWCSKKSRQKMTLAVTDLIKHNTSGQFSFLSGRDMRTSHCKFISCLVCLVFRKMQSLPHPIQQTFFEGSLYVPGVILHTGCVEPM